MDASRMAEERSASSTTPDSRVCDSVPPGALDAGLRHTEPVRFEAQFIGEFLGSKLAYRAIASETFVRDEGGQPRASFFGIAYVVANTGERSDRPVTFIFNGGPGASSQWLHMGVFGPKRVVVPGEPRNAGSPAYEITTNVSSILAVSDIVFIDPIGTGYSRTIGEKDPGKFFGLMEDAKSIANFIEVWVTENRRWNSPKFIIGESYGTTRACLVADILGERNLALNGIVLIASVLDYQNSRPRMGDGGILSYVSFLPTFAATAWYHGCIEHKGRSLETLLTEVKEFACSEYAQALIANYQRLEASKRAHIVSRLSAYTGLRESYIDRSRLRVPVERFIKELLRSRGLVVGRLDSRYSCVENDWSGERAESDPSLDAVGSAYTSAMNVQLNEIGVRIDRPYVASSKKAFDSWNWNLEERTPNGGGYINVIPQLGRAMRRNVGLRVLVASGYYDLATPFLGVENALSQDGLQHDRIEHSYYEAGHMLFLHEPSRIRLLERVGALINAPSAAPLQSAQ